MDLSSESQTEAEPSMMRRYLHHVVWVRYAWSHGADAAVEQAFRTFVYPTFIERFDYQRKDDKTYENVQRNLETIMQMVVEAFRPLNPFRFDQPGLGLIFVAWLTKSKQIIYRYLPNLSGENLNKAWAEMTVWFLIICSKGGSHVEPFKVSAREVKFHKQIRKMKAHLGVYGRP
ncbi:uncharacterized protein FSUBG_1913 [Fusarium subglutinans]|uniref:Uncharacterized protein n=1 Tax=Gibberella subglutinans TaxID=42677 RepID=A0A8H5QDF9_GIBSU|nr:uncharacterized protein FSUBG_1913 [Fusarium subglutinans]KAF5611886.1 hypothetical protein FSUBG_1913 [Fusarium subglutinans]